MSAQNTVRRRVKTRNKDNEDTEDAEIEVKEVVHHLLEPGDPKSWKALLTGKRAMLALGLFFGFVACTLLLTHPPPSLSLLLEEYDLPSLGSAEVEWRQMFSGNSPLAPWNLGRANWDGREFMVGEELAARGLQAQHPVILIPGIISTALENWSTTGEYKAQFRKRYWGGASMVLRAIQNPERWMAALMLDPETGLDPPGVKIRAAQGIDAAQKFIEGYWLWEKILQNLAALNYDTNNLELAAYDWRLSYRNLEIRDGYFSRLKHNIESYNAGEMKDTVSVGPAASYVLERYFSKRDRAKLFRSWAGSASMWIKGGDAIWGNGTHAPDDMEDGEHTQGHFISFRPKANEEVPHVMDERPSVGNLTVTAASNWILSHTPSSYQRMISANYSFGFERDEKRLAANNHDFTKWTNPLEVQLPLAPSMKMYCVYGHGLETERSYWYARGKYIHDDTLGDAARPQCHNESECSTPLSEFPLHRTNWIDNTINIDTAKPKVKSGVKIGEGDGTVSLLSLGAMCVEGWKRPRWNPGGIQVTTVEVAHEPEAYHIRGGASSGDHIDILGGTPLNEVVGKVATGVGHEVQENIVSNIREYVKRINWD
ncbi:hypothetical protein M408DRAFT_332589 [Serendipita vermifera MAFF 305830]|uniref:Phospholipid:diacylglycerol acyltransferase n=1 Tax=Serendipita vermifera MAFF 305830 TaxID=933852 RepID=A0A0C3AUT7_SERVB|nr:hypothetical protein M408DRAFT_332589 [Serendipita vermifera MAFF 305830]